MCRSGSICSVQREASGLWTMLFVLSKFIELGDTLLLVLAKKPVSFLHWSRNAMWLL